MRNLKIGTRLALGFGLMIVLLLILSSIGAWRMYQTEQDSSMLIQRQHNNSLILRWARQVDVNANQALAAANLTNPDVLKVFKDGMAATDQKSDEIRDQIQKGLNDPAAAAQFKKALEFRDQYQDGRAKAFKNLDNGDYADADRFFNQEMPKITAQYIAEIDKLEALQNSIVAQDVANGTQANRLGLTILGIATLLALILGPLFAWFVTRSVTHPLRQAVRLADAVSRRDLSLHVQVNSKDEIGQLLHTLDAMGDNLREAVGEVRSGATSIAAASGQISAGNLDLSSRTEQQASSLAETAATMEEITATVRQNADSTQQANTLAAAAAKTATQGGSLVSELVGTMGEINSKSQQVADIIGVIDSIAFQTNILALNAAVEAARAGEQGRGFAVVAAEVRALAQRSASAAKEIKGLIDSSVEATTKGNDQAAHAGATMQEIVDSINRVTDIMGEISAANREQTTGIEEINSAITQMDDVTRQNASLVEESAAAATSLQSQADTLAQLVATFKLGDQDTGAGQASAGQAGAARPAPVLSAPEKVISPAPARARPTPAAPAAPAASGSRPALRAPGRPAPSTTDTDEWTEF
ncbi:methyl-accepting chemotaxis protein [Castellaniella sp. FW104-16D08]|uniref:methyl-accepting chemotaxis protein n=1 Tax=unclassified Castellaniella TaxID=2617606 RepID=UPI00331633E5